MFLLGVGAAEYRGRRLAAIAGRLVWLALMYGRWTLPFVTGLPHIGRMQFLKPIFTREVIAAIRAVGQRELAEHPGLKVVTLDSDEQPAEFKAVASEHGWWRWDIYRGESGEPPTVRLITSNHMSASGIGVIGLAGNDRKDPAAHAEIPDGDPETYYRAWLDRSFLFTGPDN